LGSTGNETFLGTHEFAILIVFSGFCVSVARREQRKADLIIREDELSDTLAKVLSGKRMKR